MRQQLDALPIMKNHPTVELDRFKIHEIPEDAFPDSIACGRLGYTRHGPRGSLLITKWHLQEHMSDQLDEAVPL
jgi:hypothetical protein